MTEPTENIRTAETPPVVPEYAPEPTTAAVTPRQKRMEVRIWSGFIFGLCGFLLGVGLFLHASENGYGTHQSLGLPPCGLMQMTGYPCPTCGCTTAVTQVAHGHLIQGFVTQPFGAAVGYVAWAGVILGLIGLVTGRWVGPSAFMMQWYLTRIMVGVLALLLFAWVYKVIMVRWHLG